MPGGGGPGSSPPAHLIRRTCPSDCTHGDELYDTYSVPYDAAQTDVDRIIIQGEYDNAVENCHS